MKESGVVKYSIFLDESNNDLFGMLKIADSKVLDNLAEHEVMKLWWNHMKDIMETNSDHSPVSIPLKEVFYLP